MLNYLLAILPVSIILVVSLVTPVFIVMRCRKTMREQPEHYERVRFRAVVSFLGWMMPTLVLWCVFAMAVWVLMLPERRPEPGRIHLAAEPPNGSSWKGYLIWLGFVAIYSLTCYLLAYWNSRSIGKM